MYQVAGVFVHGDAGDTNDEPLLPVRPDQNPDGHATLFSYYSVMKPSGDRRIPLHQAGSVYQQNSGSRLSQTPAEIVVLVVQTLLVAVESSRVE